MKAGDGGCVEWKGRKYYGRPAWTLWMQRVVWEEANGPLPPRSTVSETCGNVGCLALAHLQVTTRIKHERVKCCRWCGGVLSRDKRDKTYCPMCQREKARARRDGRTCDASVVLPGTE
mgnify:CR=1 FL=1